MFPPEERRLDVPEEDANFGDRPPLAVRLEPPPLKLLLKEDDELTPLRR